MGTYISPTDLELALSPTVYASIYDDANNGVIDAAAVALVIELAEGDAQSYLIGFYDFPLRQPLDALMRGACLDFARARSYERNLDYVREMQGQHGFDVEATRKGAIDRMLRIQAGTQKLPDQPAPATTPLNTGGIVRVSGPRLIVTGIDGAQNGDGF